MENLLVLDAIMSLQRVLQINMRSRRFPPKLNVKKTEKRTIKFTLIKHLATNIKLIHLVKY